MNLNRNISFYNADSEQFIKQYSDNEFDLAFVDCPYGIGESGQSNKSRGKKAVAKDYGNKNWDSKPPLPEFFEEIFRISKHQVIFGANHFIENLPKEKRNSSCWLVWDKQNGKNDFADSELAWTSFPTAVRNFHFRWAGMLQGDMRNKQIRIHPTQKPIQLYRWILQNYAQKDWKIIDPFLGSGSSAIASYHFGITDFVGIEKDKEYFDESVAWFNKDTYAPLIQKPKIEQLSIAV